MTEDYEFEHVPVPILERLTPEIIARIGDDAIEGALAGYVMDNVSDAEDELAALDELPPALRDWYVAFVVDSEVLNGGFNQFFFNSSNGVAPAAPDALRRLGIPEAGAFVAKALTLLDTHSAALEQADEAGTAEAFMETYLDEPFSELDEQYAAGEARWRHARLRFIRSELASLTHP